MSVAVEEVPFVRRAVDRVSDGQREGAVGMVVHTMDLDEERPSVRWRDVDVCCLDRGSVNCLCLIDGYRSDGEPNLIRVRRSCDEKTHLQFVEMSHAFFDVLESSLEDGHHRTG